MKVGVSDFRPAASLVYYLEPVLAMLTVLVYLTPVPLLAENGSYLSNPDKQESSHEIYTISLFVGLWEKNVLQYPRKHKKPKNYGHYSLVMGLYREITSSDPHYDKRQGL